MNKFIKFTLLLCGVATISMAQSTTTLNTAADNLKQSLATNDALKEGWNRSGQLTIGFAQGHLENWAAGGEVNSLNTNMLLNGYMTKKTGKKLWENTYVVSYGLSYLQSNNFVPLKTDDRIDLSTKYGFQMKQKSKWYWTALARLQTQFSNGYNYSYKNPIDGSNWFNNQNASLISKMFSPAYVTLALGANYVPNKNFSWFISPLSARFIFVNKYFTQSASAFGVDQGKTFVFQLGAYSSMIWQKQITENIMYKTRLDLYMDYLDKKGFGNVDILWDNMLNLKVSKYIGMGLGLTFVYDNDVHPQYENTATPVVLNSFGWTQMKQVMTLGFSYQIH